MIARTLGPRHAILAVVLACAVLTYGGISLFVVAFAVYPFAAMLFRAADIPKRLLPGAIALGAFTLTMDALPGHSADPEPDPHPLFRDRRLRRRRWLASSAAWPSSWAACSGSSAAAHGRRPPARDTARGTGTSPIRRPGRSAARPSVARGRRAAAGRPGRKLRAEPEPGSRSRGGTRPRSSSATSRRSTSRRPRRPGR